MEILLFMPPQFRNLLWMLLGQWKCLKVKDTSHITGPITLLGCCSTFPGERNVSVNETHSAAGCNPNLKLTDLCWSKHEITRGAVYRIFVVTYKFLQLLQWKIYWCNYRMTFVLQGVFAVTIGSFAFFNVQKTLIIQLITGAMRWIGEMEIIITINNLFKILAFGARVARVNS